MWQKQFLMGGSLEDRLRPSYLVLIKPRAVFHSGSDDDSRVYIPLQDFIRLTGIQPNTALVRMEGQPQEIHNAISSLSAALPNVEVKPVRQITQAQTAVVGKTRSVVLASSAAVVVLIMLCMVATFTGSVLERRKDFAVMKALGASNRTVNFLFASESACWRSPALSRDTFWAVASRSGSAKRILTPPSCHNRCSCFRFCWEASRWR